MEQTLLLIKPNVVSADVRNLKATITNPVLVESVCKILKRNECKIFIGESSFMSTDDFLKKVGLNKIAKKYGAKLLVFELDKSNKNHNFSPCLISFCLILFCI